jgi:hypothetical protein
MAAALITTLCVVCANLDLSCRDDGQIQQALHGIKTSVLETRCCGCEVLWFAMEPYVNLAEAA